MLGRRSITIADLPYKPIYCTQVAFNTTTTGGTPVNVHGCQKLILRSVTDVYVDFDQPVAPSTSYLISGANTADTEIEIPRGSVSQLYVSGRVGSGTLYIIVITD